MEKHASVEKEKNAQLSDLFTAGLRPEPELPVPVGAVQAEAEAPAPEAAAEEKAAEKTASSGKVKKRVAAAVFTAFTSLSLVISSLFSSPEALLEEKAALKPEGPAIVQMVSEEDGEDTDEEDEEGEEETEKDWRTVLRAWFLRLPLVVRALFFLPLWAVGHGIAAGAAALWEPVLSPLLAAALKWVLIALVLAGIVVCFVKAIAPGTPIRKILNRKTIPAIAGAAVGLFVIDYTLPFVWKEYTTWRNVVCFILGGMVLMSILVGIGRSRAKKAEKEA